MNQSCPKCGAVFPDTFTFCKQDGTALIPLTAGTSFDAGQPTMEAPAPPPRPSYSLFGVGSFGLATAFGTPIAGSILMAVNYRRLGRPRAAITTVITYFIVTAVLVLLGTHMPSGLSSAIGIVVLIATISSFKAAQGKELATHTERGGKIASPFVGLGVGLIVSILSIGAAAGFLYLQNERSQVTIGSNDKVYLSGSATRSEAQALGQSLKSVGYFLDRGFGVILSKGKDGVAIAFIVKDGIWDEPRMVWNYEEIGREVASSVGGLPIKVRLANSAREIKSESNIGEVFVGRDQMFYFGSATSADAQALGKALKDAGYFTDRGVTVMLSKHSEGTALSFVVQERLTKNSRTTPLFEQLVRQVASSVGGLPIKMRLLNPQLAPETEAMVN